MTDAGEAEKEKLLREMSQHFELRCTSVLGLAEEGN